MRMNGMDAARTALRIAVSSAVALALADVPDRLAGYAGIPLHAGVRSEACRLAMMLALFVGLGQARGNTPDATARACRLLGALAVLVLALSVAARIAALSLPACGAPCPHLDPAQAAAVARSFAWLLEQGRQTAALCCGAWVFVALGRRDCRVDTHRAGA
jgi:hypothetical protein